MLEKYFRQKLTESGLFSEISSYWDKKGTNEIDIIAINQTDQSMVFYEVKRSKTRISLPQLQTKSEIIIKNYLNYTIQYEALSLDDM